MAVVEEDKERTSFYAEFLDRGQELLQLFFAVEVVVALGNRGIEPVSVSAVEPEVTDGRSCPRRKRHEPFKPRLVHRAVTHVVFLEEVKGLFFMPAVVSELNDHRNIAEPVPRSLQIVSILLGGDEMRTGTA